MQPELFQLLSEAASLLVVGMTMVFAFLIMLIVAMQLIASLVARFPSIEEQGQQAFRSSATSSNTSQVSPATIAAISAAIHQHRSK